jgi:hypothetical protein
MKVAFLRIVQEILLINPFFIVPITVHVAC